ncbi:SDR family NAD(P)-dependent oxidoreductase [Paenibacillus eucommiae]|uniref:NAD(P)-dependent dehydrogenase (Short-subunit alcohol dehydrogenase family) n=1 Tax=Paenibacillus eucommiae TaxID=1355755 RepID=A0ABS4IXH5_9BACL|nr:SDR family oxidoreductase [Paenibacillus eucommiae]MBP1992285.1 NAD(P)-dependent dehydrogenase (short-subunit alcohol dehydrogenase family) [Paenibacillus eucommiae]
MNTMDMFRLDGKVAIVTGGSGVYGQHLCLGLCEAGALVIVAGNELDACEAAAEKFTKAGHKAVAMHLDLSKEESINALANQVAEQYGSIDTLVNCAVSRAGNQNLEDAEAELWEASERINGTGTMLMTKAVIKYMRKQGKGSIINISSIMGVVGPYFPMYEQNGSVSGLEYTYTKSAMFGMTKWLANFYGKYNIRVNSISPGGNNIAGTKDEIGSQALIDTYLSLTPMNRFADEHDLKGPVVFLASDASRYMTGQNLIVDGGYTNW